MSKATDEQVEAAALVIAGNVTPAQMAANPEEAKFARETALAALTAAAALEDVSSIHEAEPVDGKSSPEVKAICDTLDFLRRGKHEPYWLNARDGIALMSPLLRAATKLDKLERAAHPAPIHEAEPVAWANVRADGIIVGLSELRPDNWLNEPRPLIFAEVLEPNAVEPAWDDLPSGVSSSIARKAFKRFMHHSEFPASPSAMREAIEFADTLRRREGGETVSVPRQDLDQLLSAIEGHWNDEMAKGRKRWHEESLIAKWIINLRTALAHPAPISKGVTVKAFQDRVAEAHHALFHDDPTDLSERRDRFYEEATETAQALGMTEADAHALVSYTFSRPIGEPEKEIGAAALTLASLCVVGGWDMMACAEADLAKLQQPATIERIRTKRLTRHGRGPLPGLSHTAGEP